MRLLLGLIVVMIIFSCSTRNSIVDKDKLLGNDYRLFQGTPVWNLAKAVEDENISEIKRIVKEDKIDIDFKESKFGNTLLMLTIINEQFNSCETLLELGASPKIHNNASGSSAIIYAAGVNSTSGDNVEFLKLILMHGGDPNDLEVGARKTGNTSRNTPLIMACGNTNKIVSPIEKVKILIEFGADINYKNEYGTTALKMAYMQAHLDVVLYLLKKGADFNEPIYNRDEKDIFLWDDLREQTYPLDSKQYKYKMEIVEFLKQKGIDYRKLPIPEFIIEDVKETYPDNWREYLDKY